MKVRIYGALLVFFLLITVPVFSQETEGESDGQTDDRDFFLLPVLETVFSGNLRWSPNWPSDIPPDGFFLPPGNLPLKVIELSNGNDTFVLERDSEGRLLQFPFFYEGGYAKASIGYSPSGAVQTMNIEFKNIQAQEEESQDDEEKGEGEEEETWDITFPLDFLPYSELSLGGSFPVIRVSSGDSDYFVFIFESPLFLTETWYDSEGNMLVFCKASVNAGNGAWRIRSLQIHGESGVRFEDRFFDSYGNVTEIRLSSDDSEDRKVLALYRDSIPVYWRRDGFIYDLQWDTRGILTVIKAWDETGAFDTEYRYRYEDNSGIWVRREEAAYRVQYDLLTPQPSYSRGIWTRRPEFFPAVDGE
jgi:hypothetical protein